MASISAVNSAGTIAELPSALVPYQVSVVTPKKPENNLFEKILNYVQELFKVLPLSSTWMRLSGVEPPLVFDAIGGGLSLVASVYGLVKQVKKCIAAKTGRELAVQLLAVFSSLVYIFFAVLSILSLFSVLTISPWFGAILGTMAVCISLSKFFHNEFNPEDKDEGTKLVIPVPTDCPPERIASLRHNLQEWLQRPMQHTLLSSSSSSRPRHVRALSY